MTILKSGRRAAVALACALAATPAAFAETNSGDTAWVLTATALVLMMTLPALALFYGGLVQSKNVLSVLSQCVVIACLMSVLWLVAGYSIAFGDGGASNAIWGGFGKAFLGGVEASSESGTAPHAIPESVFFMFQMTFAIITPALIVGAYPERTSFAFVLVFSSLWMLLVYAPVAHWVWAPGGWLFEQGVRDFAGGLVVHATAGSSALVVAVLVGKRKHFPHELRPPHSPVFVMIGAALLWVGWYGFNAGSALAAGHNAGNAMLVTHISASVGALTWMGIEWVKFGRPGLVGIVTGLVAGLATITPAAGSVGPSGALVVGFAASMVCYFSVALIRNTLKIDDSLDVFAVHGVGGVLGTLILPMLATVGPLSPGLGEVAMDRQAWVQVQGVVAVIVWSVAVTLVIVKVTGLVVRPRVRPEAEIEGLDMHLHGERGYHGIS